MMFISRRWYLIIGFLDTGAGITRFYDIRVLLQRLDRASSPAAVKLGGKTHIRSDKHAALHHITLTNTWDIWNLWVMPNLFFLLLLLLLLSDSVVSVP